MIMMSTRRRNDGGMAEAERERADVTEMGPV
jgi:hypothetical protein